MKLLRRKIIHNFLIKLRKTNVRKITQFLNKLFEPDE